MFHSLGVSKGDRMKRTYDVECHNCGTLVEVIENTYEIDWEEYGIDKLRY